MYGGTYQISHLRQECPLEQYPELQPTVCRKADLLLYAFCAVQQRRCARNRHIDHRRASWCLRDSVRYQSSAFRFRLLLRRLLGDVIRYRLCRSDGPLMKLIVVAFAVVHSHHELVNALTVLPASYLHH